MVSTEPSLCVCFVGKRVKVMFLGIVKSAVRAVEASVARLMGLDQFLPSQEVGAKERCWV